MRGLIILSLISLAMSMRQKPEVDRTGFGPKTVYEWVPDINLSVSENKDMVVHHKNRVCTAVHTSMVIRHGNRWPGPNAVADMEELAQRLNDSNVTPATSIQFITDRWNELFYSDDIGELDYYGETEMEKIGQRTYQRFNELFQTNNGIIELISSDMNRTYLSGEIFSNAFIRKHSIYHHKNDALVRFYSNCSAYEVNVEENENITEEVNKYTSTFEVQRVLQKIEDRLQIKGFANLTYNDAKRILEWCAMNMVNEGANNPWCKVMTSYERKVIEYAADLEYYLRYSYGNNLMEKISCVIIQKWMETMDNKIADLDNKSEVKILGWFMFGHSGTLLGTLTALGLFKDAPPLSATNVKPKRYFKNSQIAPMSGNVGIALYSCASDSPKDEKPKYAVQIFVNEQGVQLPQFSNKVVWYDDFKRVFSATECNIETTCEVDREKELKSGEKEDVFVNKTDDLNSSQDTTHSRHFNVYVVATICLKECVIQFLYAPF